LGAGVLSDDGQAGFSAYGVIPFHTDFGGFTTAQDRILFLEPRLARPADDVISTSLGLGFRRLYGDPTQGKSKLSTDIDLFGEGWYLGGNLFVDQAYNQAYNASHWQVGTGFEVGSRYISLRANYYVPLSDPKRTGTQAASFSPLPNSHELSIGPPVSTPYSTIHDIRVNYLHNTLVTTLDLFDEAVQGWDSQLSLLVPKLDQWVDLRLTVGLYGFDRGDTTPSFGGWTAGLELRPVPSVVLTALHYKDDRQDEGQWMAGVRFEMPLNGNRQDWLRPRRRSLRERLMEPVGRHQGPVIAEGTKLTTQPSEFVSEIFESGIIDGALRLPRAGDTIVDEYGDYYVVEADGKSVRQATPSEVKQGAINPGFLPEPHRAVFLTLGLAFGLLRRRRPTTR
jgi:Inverse autotransporter, beta-domain